MVYCYQPAALPQISMAYSVIRRTVWRIADPFHILIYIKTGHCRIKTDGEEYLLEPGDVFYLPPDCQYERTPVNDEFCEMYYVHFKLAGSGEQLEREQARQRLAENSQKPELPEILSLFVTHRTSMKKDLLLENLLSDIVKYASREDHQDQQLAAISLCRILAAVSRQTAAALYQESNSSTVGKHPQNLKKALSYISQHYTEKITLEDLCRVSYVSKQMLIRYFNSEFGKTPITYIIEYKVDKIKQMLTTYPDVSIKELCGEFGFDDQCYFSRIFKKVTGESPSDYRNRVTHFDEDKHLNGL